MIYIGVSHYKIKVHYNDVNTIIKYFLGSCVVFLVHGKICNVNAFKNSLSVKDSLEPLLIATMLL